MKDPNFRSKRARLVVSFLATRVPVPVQPRRKESSRIHQQEAMDKGSRSSGMDRSETTGILLFGASVLMSHLSFYYFEGQQQQSSKASGGGSTRLVRYLSQYSKWRSYSDDEETYIQELPKVELHVHLDGSCDADFIWDFLQDHPEAIQKLPVSIENPPWDPSTKELIVQAAVKACQNQRDYHSICTCRGHRSLTQMLNCFQMFLPVLQGDLRLLEQLAYDFCLRQSQQNIVYTEVRYSPHLLSSETVAPCAVIQAVTKGLRRGCQATGIVVNQILCAISWRPEWALDVVALVQSFQESPCAVVGVDVAAGEEHFDPQSPFHAKHLQMSQLAQSKGIPMTLHAGEIPHSNAHVCQAVNEYHARRIGHGYRMAEDAKIMEFIREQKIHVEVCLTSSVETGGWVYQGDTRQWSQHPARTMMDAGVSLSFSSDDPAVFHTSLAWQYRTALNKMNTSKSELIQANFDAIEAAFCSEETRQDIKKILVAFADENGVPGFELERSEHGLPLEQRQSLLKNAKTPSFTDRVYLSNAEYT